ncbi:hypothetical protein Tco_1051065 [Tanacetum coccineum]
MAKVYDDNKSTLKKEHWILKPDGTRGVAGIRSRPPTNSKQAYWDMQIDYWLDPKHAARALQNTQNRAKSKGSRSLAVLRDMQMESSKTREYPSLIQTFFDTHTDGGDLRMTRREFNIGDDMAEGSRRQYANGCALHRGPDNSHGLKGQAARAHSRSEGRISQLLTQLESQHKVDGGSGSGEGGDDEPGADEDADRDKNS